MNTIDLLHPGLQHHIVNSLGWSEFRPFQDEVIPAVLAGSHVLVIAPTAGGKTEAAIFPVLSRMLSEDWRGLSTIYLCPIKALLNNLHVRLSRYATLVGRTCSVWHGDTSPTERSRIKREPPDIILTTPESLELMLVSTKTDPAGFFSKVRVVIVDELHAFAGDDRGWHMLSVLQRVSCLSGQSLQRIGLSATVGNPERLLTWLTCGSKEPARVVQPPASAPAEASVQLDFVESLENAAMVISRLYRGEKRLVFVDSRARAEALGAELLQLEVKTFVTHSSLSKEQRTQTERAFAEEKDCVIVATSVLELGVDIGDLDRVIQVDAPSTVASFLQRMGRTGRRDGSKRNCLFLATHEFALLQSAALLKMWASGYVEDIHPPPLPFHVFAQQLLALVLQNREFVRSDWPRWIGSVPAFDGFREKLADVIIDFELREKFLVEDGGVLHIGPEAEKQHGRRHFSDLLSVITSHPLFQVRFGRADIGVVHPLSFTKRKDSSTVLALGGKGWRVLHIDWDRKIAHVEPTKESGRSRWMGSSVPLSPALCQAMRDLVRSDDVSPSWSQRAVKQIENLREEFRQFCGVGTVIGRRGESVEWWTFAGLKTNQTIVQFLQPNVRAQLRADNLWISLPAELPIEEFHNAIKSVDCRNESLAWKLEDKGLDTLKFADLLPPEILKQVVDSRLADVPGARKIFNAPIRIVV